MLWLSFCDSSRPKGTRFRGVVIIQADNVIEGAHVCWELGVNPGGEIVCVPIPANMESFLVACGQQYLNRLLSRKDINQLENAVENWSTTQQILERAGDRKSPCERHREGAI